MFTSWRFSSAFSIVSLAKNSIVNSITSESDSIFNSLWKSSRDLDRLEFSHREQLVQCLLHSTHFGKIYFGKIHFGKIYFGKIHFGKIHVVKIKIHFRKINFLVIKAKEVSPEAMFYWPHPKMANSNTYRFVNNIRELCEFAVMLWHFCD